jgi:DNA-binding protein HU-beta
MFQRSILHRNLFFSARDTPERQVKTRVDFGKQDLVNIVSQNCQLTKQESKVAVDCLFDSIMAAVSNGDKVSVPGFGSFERSIRSARQGRNPSTGESLWIKESASVSFKAGSTFKSTVKERYNEQQN